MTYEILSKKAKTQIKKGVEVYRFWWSPAGVMWVRKFTVDSWGKKSGTLLLNGDNLGRGGLVWARDYKQYIAASDLTDVDVMAAELAESFHQAEMATMQERIAACSAKGRESDLVSLKKHFNELVANHGKICSESDVLRLND